MHPRLKEFPMPTITPFLWFDGQAQEAMTFYTSIFKDSKVISSNPMSVQFELLGQRFIGLNAGPHHKFNPAVSLFVEVETQAEIDNYWNKLLDGGGRPDQCGWLQDKFGLSWQVIPKGAAAAADGFRSGKGQARVGRDAEDGEDRSRGIAARARWQVGVRALVRHSSTCRHVDPCRAGSGSPATT
jgi:predicted 3-demethylubiquinone-9 3-methyltransferase (glyoxalase superfamily)